MVLHPTLRQRIQQAAGAGDVKALRQLSTTLQAAGAGSDLCSEAQADLLVACAHAALQVLSGALPGCSAPSANVPCECAHQSTVNLTVLCLCSLAMPHPLRPAWTSCETLRGAQGTLIGCALLCGYCPGTLCTCRDCTRTQSAHTNRTMTQLAGSRAQTNPRHAPPTSLQRCTSSKAAF